jgi:hypothetical protein
MKLTYMEALSTKKNVERQIDKNLSTHCTPKIDYVFYLILRWLMIEITIEELSMFNYDVIARVKVNILMAQVFYFAI